MHTIKQNLLAFFCAGLLCTSFTGYLPAGDTCLTAQAKIGGSCGENAEWTLESDGTLRITGTGAMQDFNQGGYNYPNENIPDASPWRGFETSIKKIVVSEGITHIGDYS